MTASKPQPQSKAWYGKPVRIARTHIKLVVSAALGVALFFLLPRDLWVSTRALIAWNIAVALYLAAATYVIARSKLAHLQQRAADEDEGGALILVLTVSAAVASLVAIFAELGAVRGDQFSGVSAGFAVSTVVLSWVFIHVIFAFHYAHAFYGHQRVDARLRRTTAKGGHKGGLTFPDDDRPDYWDFLYFSFVLGMTFQVSDVQVTSKPLRRVVLGHGIVSFFYNVAVLALMVNIGGEFIKG
jgi:uncharacterized membrane protein